MKWKEVQQHELVGDKENPVTVEMVRRVIVDPNAN